MFTQRTADSRQRLHAGLSHSRTLTTLISLLALFVTAGAARAATVTVAAGANLQAAIDAAQPGDTLVLEAGASFVGPFTLPYKGTSSEWITIRSSAPGSSLPAAGQRTSPSYAPLMPKILSPGVGEPALRTAAGAHHYRFESVEFRSTDASGVVYDLIRLGDGSSAQNTMESVPHHLAFDRCLVTAFPTQGIKRGIALNSGDTQITGCWIAGIKALGQDSQALGGWNGPGPYLIENNYLEAAGENVMFGGATASVPALIPSDIIVRRNNFFKPLSWKEGEPTYAGVTWSVKNLFELKNARRVVVEGNVFENNWVQSQSGYAIVLTVRGDNPWATIEDVDFKNNVVRHTASAFNILGHDTLQTSAIGHGLNITNNLFEDVGAPRWGGYGIFLKISEMAQTVVAHNTVLQSGNVTTVYGPASLGFVMRDNITPHNEYGIIGDGTAPGVGTINTYFPSGVFAHNMIAAANADRYPANNFYPASLDSAQFADAAHGDYRLAASSPYKSAATDGTDLGCDFDKLNAALTGTNPTPTPTPTPTATPTPSPTPTATPTPTPTPSPTPTPNPTPTPTPGSPASLTLVAQAQALAASLASDPSSGAQQISPLVASVEQAYTVFTTESSRFASAAQIDTSLRAALYFARASQALASAEGASTGAQSRLQIASSQLALTRDLMSGNASGETVAGANPASVTRTNVIGVAATASSASLAPALAPDSLGVITGDPAQSPLALQTAAANFDQSGRPPFELAGVSVTVGGRAAQILSVSPSRVGFVVPAGLPAGDAEVIVTLQQGYVSRGTVAITQIAPGIFTSDGSGAGGALVMNAATYASGSFEVWTQGNFSADKHTRLMIFATGLRGAANTNTANDVAGAGANLAESVVVEAHLQNNLVYQLPVEYAGAAQSGAAGVDQVNVMLFHWFMGAGPVDLTIIVNGQRSNTATIIVR